MKLLIKLLAILILGAVALLVAGYFLLPPAAKKAVDGGSEYAFGVPASVQEIGASPGFSRTGFGFEGYRLQSPAGIDEPLLTIGSFDVGVGTRSIIGDVKEVSSFALNDVELTIVQDGTSSNLLPVIEHLRDLGARAGAGEPGPSEDSDGPGPRLNIGKIEVSGVAGRIIVRGAGPLDIDQRFEIPAYTTDLTELTGSEGKTVAEVAGLMMTDLKDKALAAADGVVPAPALGLLDKALSGGIDGGLDGAIDAGKEALQGQLDDAKATAKDAVEDLESKGKKALEKGKEDLLKGGDKALEKLLGGDGR